MREPEPSEFGFQVIVDFLDVLDWRNAGWLPMSGGALSQQCA
jgi:hypothetical protein